MDSSFHRRCWQRAGKIASGRRCDVCSVGVRAVLGADEEGHVRRATVHNVGRGVMEEMSVQGHEIRDISCTLLPSEEVVFSVYEGPSATAVQRLNERPGIPFSRIVEAIVVTQDKKTW